MSTARLTGLARAVGDIYGLALGHVGRGGVIRLIAHVAGGWLSGGLFGTEGGRVGFRVVVELAGVAWFGEFVGL
jgi:hypothetical protein